MKVSVSEDRNGGVKIVGEDGKVIVRGKRTVLYFSPAASFPVVEYWTEEGSQPSASFEVSSVNWGKTGPYTESLVEEEPPKRKTK